MAALLIAALQLAGSETAGSQSRAAELTISVPKAVQIESGIETALPVRITPEYAVPKQAMVLLRGLPPAFTLSEGRLFESGVWGIRAGDLPRLKIKGPDGAESVQLSISMVMLDGTVLAEAVTRVSTLPRIAGAPRAVLPASAHIEQPPEGFVVSSTLPNRDPAVRNAPASRSEMAISKEDEVERLRMGKDALALGDIAGARLIFEYLAEHGSAEGAYQVARTYDAEVLTSAGVVAFKADEKTAAVWYEKAAAMGQPEAVKKAARRAER